MKILLDTHILLWYLYDKPQLSHSRSNLIDNSANKKFISFVSLWEMTIKNSLEKLELFAPVSILVPKGIYNYFVPKFRMFDYINQTTFTS